MDFSKGVLFDPGYSQHTVAFATNIDAAYNVIFSFKSMNQRKFRFRNVYPQILKLVEHTVGFYLGCLLWASYITNKFEEDPKDILDNDYLGKTVDEEAMLYEVNYLISYLDKLKKDCKFYLAKECNLPQDWYEIMSVYKDFLVGNKFLVNAKTTKDIMLPPQIKKLSNEDMEKVLEIIYAAVSNGDFSVLFSIKNLIL